MLTNDTVPAGTSSSVVIDLPDLNLRPASASLYAQTTPGGQGGTVQDNIDRWAQQVRGPGNGPGAASQVRNTPAPSTREKGAGPWPTSWCSTRG